MESEKGSTFNPSRVHNMAYLVDVNVDGTFIGCPA